MARSVRLSDDECWAVLESAHTGILTSLRRDGSPVSLPVWFVALHRRVYVAGPAPTRKFSRIRRDPRVGFLVESGTSWAELVGVHFNGRARPVAPGELLDEVTTALDGEYTAFRTAREDMPDATRSRYETATTTIEIVPEGRILSWDNSRVFEEDAP